ncbi:MAG: sodium:proton exchanger, partial [Mycobacterium sp.]|nr:sodium:proton exchanger [Mycobacterium sp.]
MITTAPGGAAGAVASGTLVRSLATTAVVICPALVVRVVGIHPSPVLGLITYGAAVVAASF